MLYQQNILLVPSRIYEVTNEQQRRLEDIIKNAKAIQFHLRKLIKKCFRLMHPLYWHNYYILKRHFNLFVLGLLSQKQQKVKLFFKKNCLLKLKSFRYQKYKQKKRLQQYRYKINQGKVKLLLQQWKKVTILQKSQKQIQTNQLKSLCKEFIELLKENHTLMKRKQIEIASEVISLQDIYCQKIVKKAFENLKINTKMQQLKRRIRNKHFKRLKLYMQRQNQEDKAKTSKFFKKNQLSKCFLFWKEQYHLQIATKFYNQRLLTAYFQHWKRELPILHSERQIQSNNQLILKIYLEKRSLKIRDQSFRRWRQLTVYHKQLSHHNQILNRFAQKQNRYNLLHKYFEKIKLNCLNNKVKLKYYQTKLKRKVIDAFKIYFSKSIEREGFILDQIDRNYLKRCFNKIKIFNKIQKAKVRIFRLKKILTAFTASIVADYCKKLDKADNFNRLNLLYKTIFSLKKAKLQKKQQTYAIVLVNIILPLRRWYRFFRIQRYLNEKEWFLKKYIMREWRMRVIRKDSQKKIVREFKEIESAKKTMNSEQKLEMFQFENIMATIAQIRNNINSEKEEKQYGNKDLRYSDIKKKTNQIEMQTPSQSIDFSYSIQQHE